MSELLLLFVAFCVQRISLFLPSLFLCLLGYLCFFSVCCFFFSKSTFLNNYFRTTIRVSNSLHQEQARHFFGPDLCSNCLLRLSADDTSRQRVQFMLVSLFRTFSDAPTETLHTQKNRQIFFEPEKDFWMIMVSFLSLHLLAGNSGV